MQFYCRYAIRKAERILNEIFLNLVCFLIIYLFFFFFFCLKSWQFFWLNSSVNKYFPHILYRHFFERKFFFYHFCCFYCRKKTSWWRQHVCVGKDRRDPVICNFFFFFKCTASAKICTFQLNCQNRQSPEGSF